MWSIRKRCVSIFNPAVPDSARWQETTDRLGGIMDRLTMKKDDIRMVGRLLVVWLLLGITGCMPYVSVANPFDHDERYAASPELLAYQKQHQAATPLAEGALYSDRSALMDLYTDTKARRVGDIVTINIIESSSASNTANTSADRDSSLTAGIEKFFGFENSWSQLEQEYKALELLNPFSDVAGFNPFGTTSVSGSLQNAFSGKGSTTRGGSIIADVTARITEELPNDHFRIVAAREIAVNNESQHIALTGIIRGRDISAANTVLSTRIGDARISFSGSGVINDKQKPGWLTRVLDHVWPF
jgi:flagellar L-ring protein precursor FlgH